MKWKFKDCPQSIREQISEQTATTPSQSHSASPEEMNKTEAEYYQILGARALAGIVSHVRIKAMKFRVGAERCWYYPDFSCVNIKTGRIELHEVKGGFYRDDSRVKFQACKLMYPEFDWIWAQKKDGVWTAI